VRGRGLAGDRAHVEPRMDDRLAAQGAGAQHDKQTCHVVQWQHAQPAITRHAPQTEQARVHTAAQGVVAEHHAARRTGRPRCAHHQRGARRHGCRVGQWGASRAVDHLGGAEPDGRGGVGVRVEGQHGRTGRPSHIDRGQRGGSCHPHRNEPYAVRWRASLRRVHHLHATDPRDVLCAKMNRLECKSSILIDMLQRYRFRLYPTAPQRRALAQARQEDAGAGVVG
jgi:hypothetical protein